MKMIMAMTMVALVALLALSKLNAEEKTYGGRTFDDWKVLVGTDLEPETREQAMTAIGVLGHHGHATDAIEVLKRAIESESNPAVAKKGYLAVLTFGEDAIPVIEAGLSAMDQDVRRVALSALNVFFLPRGGAANDMQLGTLPGKIMPGILAIIEDSQGDVSDRITAADTLQRVFRIQSPDDEFAKNLLPTLMQVANSSDVHLASEALRAIGYLGEHAVPAIPALIDFAGMNEPLQRSSNGQTMVSRQDAAVLALGRLGPVAKDSIPVLTKLQRDSTRPELSKYIQRALDSIGSEPKGD